MLDDKVEVGKLISPVPLAAIKLVTAVEPLKISVVREDGDNVWASFQEVSPVLHSSDNSEKFLVRGTVALLNWRKLLGVEGDRMLVTLFILLGKNSP
jgi:hypothetical protein